MIYFDNSATTKPYKEVIDTFATVSGTYFGNPSSLHSLGKDAENLLNQSRKRIASLLNITDGNIIFTSGGTEGNNLAVKGTALAYEKRGRHIITTNIEHPSVKETCETLKKSGYKITYVAPDQNGKVTAEKIKEQITEETILVSVIHVNNETGAVQPVEEIGELLKNYPKTVFHVDDVQGYSKVPVDIEKAGIDLYTLSAHKLHGLKGTGILYVKNGKSLTSLADGGLQEHGFRAGTQNTAGAVTMAKAIRLLNEEAELKMTNLKRLSAKIEKHLSEIEGVVINSPVDRAPHILNISVPGLKPEVLTQALGEKEIYVSTKSACSSKQFEPSKVLLASGCSEAAASSALRLSFSFNNTEHEADTFLREFKEIITSMKKVVKQ